jgi:hypothetical protein
VLYISSGINLLDARLLVWATGQLALKFIFIFGSNNILILMILYFKINRVVSAYII